MMDCGAIHRNFCVYLSGFFISGLVFSTAVQAQEVTTTVNCEITQICDHIGECRVGADKVTFAFKSIRTGMHGEGQYQLTYDTVQTEMTNLSMVGPWIWDEGTAIMHTMHSTGQEEALWIKSSMSHPVTSEILFLNCGDGT